mgnify:FL=1|jgi:hypothetical protein
MTAITYNTLVTQIKNTMEDDGTEFETAIPDFIRRAELKLTHSLDNEGLTEYATSQFTASDPFLTLPTGTLIIKNVNFINSGGSRISLLLRTKEYVEDYWPVRASVGVPKYYAKFRNDKILIAPTPTSANSVELEYIIMPSALSTSKQSNYFTNFCENALFYASMVEACHFNKNATAAQVWEAQYQNEIILLANEARRNRRDDMETVASPAGSGDTMRTGVT